MGARRSSWALAGSAAGPVISSFVAMAGTVTVFTLPAQPAAAAVVV